MIQVSRDIADALARMAILHAMSEDEEHDTDEQVEAEYRKFVPEMVDEFFPLIQNLIAAGLLTVRVDLEGHDASGYAAIDGKATEALDKGSIRLACKCTGGTLRKA